MRGPQVPLASGSRDLKRLVRADMFAEVRKQFDADREGRFKGEAPLMMPVVAEDPMAPAALPTADIVEMVYRDRTDSRPLMAQRSDAAHGRNAR